jgi:heme-degrading monooxygenase HmoA
LTTTAEKLDLTKERILVGQMIARIWHGRVPAEKADSYHAYLLKTGVKDYEAVAGNRGVYILRRVEEQIVHFELLTLWDSMEAIKAFAGEDYERARYYPEDDEFLLEREPHVRHFEVLYVSQSPSN